MDNIIRFYRKQLRRYLWPSVGLLIIDFVVLFLTPEFPGRLPVIAALSGALGGFVKFFVAERITLDKLNDTLTMIRYWVSLTVGAVLGFFSYLLLIDARLLKIVYPSAKIEPGSEPSAISAAIFGAIAGLLAEQLVSAAQRQFRRDGGPVTPQASASSTTPPERGRIEQ